MEGRPGRSRAPCSQPCPARCPGAGDTRLPPVPAPPAGNFAPRSPHPPHCLVGLVHPRPRAPRGIAGTPGTSACHAPPRALRRQDALRGPLGQQGFVGEPNFALHLHLRLRPGDFAATDLIWQELHQEVREYACGCGCECGCVEPSGAPRWRLRRPTGRLGVRDPGVRA